MLGYDAGLVRFGAALLRILNNNRAAFRNAEGIYAHLPAENYFDENGMRSSSANAIDADAHNVWATFNIISAQVCRLLTECGTERRVIEIIEPWLETLLIDCVLGRGFLVGP